MKTRNTVYLLFLQYEDGFRSVEGVYGTMELAQEAARSYEGTNTLATVAPMKVRFGS